MTEPVHFQWQNEALLKTIYLLRALKLQDFLVFFREVDLWAEHKDKPHDSLLGEIDEYIKAQTQAVAEMKEAFACFKDYFEHPIEGNPSTAFVKRFSKDSVDLQAIAQRNGIDMKAPVTTTPSGQEYIKIANLHNTCQDYLHIYNGDLHKEKIFMAQRVSEWEDHYKDLYRKWQRTQVVEAQKIRLTKRSRWRKQIPGENPVTNILRLSSYIVPHDCFIISDASGTLYT